MNTKSIPSLAKPIITIRSPNKVLIQIKRKSRKRTPNQSSLTKADPIMKTQKRRERNRLSAKKSRDKKKMYISQIEREVGELRQERARLIKLVNTLNEEVERYRKQSSVDLFFRVLNDKFGIQPTEFASKLISSSNNEETAKNEYL
ncbi:ccaat/enhancer-binding protein-related [Anaeramoeba flamelloides]|uniref:Ccaat/enhancer-binding protein-related n=1 Tax=Anaeramoeba flamelloides TaxID=1746091 RepID=A0AAV8ACY5_9EUKA|nr:ccaat/enhancer-binding protein-related [Anaeramoeba flamelloides]KAJ6255416.1 ccaat/enhancer-binding protein-related [Anaeramoeba flamelloides]|eukprot:Anaeramoba_flamelloidesa92029_45.p1 GENE.a92029_45~~a92029_45.p1  ORF type:complete len:146 (+),score=23.37 a92029_45:121-558(+)